MNKVGERGVNEVVNEAFCKGSPAQLTCPNRFAKLNATTATTSTISLPKLNATKSTTNKRNDFYILVDQSWQISLRSELPENGLCPYELLLHGVGLLLTTKTHRVSFMAVGLLCLPCDRMAQVCTNRMTNCSSSKWVTNSM